MPRIPVTQGEGEKHYELQSVAEMAKGDLYVKFNVTFPEQIDSQKRAAIVEVLKQANEAEADGIY